MIELGSEHKLFNTNARCWLLVGQCGREVGHLPGRGKCLGKAWEGTEVQGRDVSLERRARFSGKASQSTAEES